MSRYLISVIEQGLWSILNLGVNLLLIRLCAPSDYGSFAFWSASAFILASVQNALTVFHLQVLSPGDGLDPARLPTERIMHAVNGVFLMIVMLATLAGALWLRRSGDALGAPAAAVFVPAFLLQQYIRALAFSRGRPATAAVQTGLVLLSASGLLGGAALLLKTLSADQVLICLGAGYGVVGAAGAARAVKGQMAGFRPRELERYAGYLAQSGWVFLGVTSTELLARFYTFVVAGLEGPVAAPLALASLQATQLLLRPVPLLASSWSMVARADLARKRDGGDWSGFMTIAAIALAGGVVIAAIWTGLVYVLWGVIAAHLFGHKYGGDQWMVLLWGLSAALSFGQVVVSSALQVLRAFKPLALANAGASAIAAVALLFVVRLYGVGGAIVGTAAGQAFEFVAMAVVLASFLAAFRRG